MKAERVPGTPEQSEQQRKTVIILAAGIAAAALAARVFGITYGLPYLFYHHDEPQIVLRALRFGTGDFNPHIFWWPGTFQMDLMFVVYAGTFLVERALGMVASSPEFAASYFRDPSAFYLTGRVATLCFGLGSVWLLFTLGKQLQGRAVGAIAAFFLSINAMHAEWSRLVLPLVPMLFWVILAILACQKLLASGAARWYLLAGVCAGLAASCLYYGGLVALMIPLAHWLRGRDGHTTVSAILLDWRPYVALGAVVATFIVVCPYCVLDWRGFTQDIAATYSGYAKWQVISGSGVLDYLEQCFTALGKSLRRAVGIPIGIAALAGLGLSLRRRTPASVLTLAFVIIYLAVLGFLTGHRGRHMAPVVPLLAILAATAVVQGSCLARPQLRRVTLVALSVLVALPSIIEVARTNFEFMHEDTRIQAKRWVEAAIPQGTRIVLDAASYRNTASAPLEETDENIEQKIRAIRDGIAPGYGYTAAYLKYYQMMLKHRKPGGPRYHQWWTESGANTRSVDWLRAHGYQYAIVSSHVTQRYYSEGFTEHLMRSTPFYRDLDSLAVLVKTFEPRPWKRPGPTLKIYRIQ
jgi:hypothetical protein